MNFYGTDLVASASARACSSTVKMQFGNSGSVATIFDSISTRNNQTIITTTTLWPGIIFYFGTNCNKIIISNEQEEIKFEGDFTVQSISFDQDERHYVVNVGAKNGKFTQTKP